MEDCKVSQISTSRKKIPADFLRHLFLSGNCHQVLLWTLYFVDIALCLFPCNVASILFRNISYYYIGKLCLPLISCFGTELHLQSIFHLSALSLSGKEKKT